MFNGNFITSSDGSAGSYLYGYPGYTYRDTPKKKSWAIKYANNGNVRIQSHNGAHCMRSYNDDIVENVCDSFEGNDWKLLYSENGFVQFKNKLTDKCLSITITAQDYSNFEFVACKTDNIPSKQLWLMQSAPRATDRMKDISDSAKRVNVIKGYENDAAIINTYTGDFVISSSGSAGSYLYGYSRNYATYLPKQKTWKIIYDENGNVRIKSKNGGNCMRSYNNNIVENVCDTFKGNDWKLIYSENGFVQLQNTDNNNCLTINEGSSYSDLALKSCEINNVSARQLWSIANYSENQNFTTINQDRGL